MMNFNVFAIIGIFTITPICVTVAEAPVFKLYEVDESNNILRPYDRGNDQGTSVIVDNLDHLRLVCQAPYPVLWTYAGNGIPITTTQEISHGQHSASVFLSHLNERHSGTYQCDHREPLTSSPFIHIFVPGENLFTSLEGQTIEVEDGESSILIPCSVSHPRVQVSLAKSTSEGLVNPVTKSGNAIAYTHRKGFRINLDDIVDADGTYVCTAQYNGIVRSVEYRVATVLEFNRPPEETCKGESCASHCSTHSDCPPMLNCYSDHICRDPCIHSIQCGIDSLCRVVSNVPRCYCPPGYVGDATTECFIP